MPNRPVPDVRSDDVGRLARLDFPPESVARVLSILARYGGRESHGVRAAALKLAVGDIGRLERWSTWR